MFGGRLRNLGCSKEFLVVGSIEGIASESSKAPRGLGHLVLHLKVMENGHYYFMM